MAGEEERGVVRVKVKLFVVLNVEMDLVLEQLPDRLYRMGLSFSPVSDLLSI